jgi:HlyD family secretion protein
LLLAGAGYGVKQLLKPPKPISVGLVAVRRGTVDDVVSTSADGEVKAARQATLRSTGAARVATLSMKRGDRVEKDAILVQFDEAALRDAVADATSKVRVSEARYREAEHAAKQREDRAGVEQRLADRGASAATAAKQAGDEASAALDSAAVAKAALADARTQLSLQREQLGRSAVRAPFAGLIADLFVQVGDTPAPSAPLCTLVDDSSIFIEAPFDEADINRVKVGMTARVQLQGTTEPVEAKVRFISPTVRVDTKGARSVVVELDLKRGDNLRIGMTANADVVVARRADVLTLPGAVVVGQGTTRLVHVLKNGVIERREVKTGISNGDVVEILSGVEEGEQIITDVNSPLIKPGVRAQGRS